MNFPTADFEVKIVLTVAICWRRILIRPRIRLLRGKRCSLSEKYHHTDRIDNHNLP
jgi:hypothetical protein